MKNSIEDVFESEYVLNFATHNIQVGTNLVCLGIRWIVDPPISKQYHLLKMSTVKTFCIVYYSENIVIVFNKFHIT